jgi:hypothetical protein
MLLCEREGISTSMRDVTLLSLVQSSVYNIAMYIQNVGSDLLFCF